jgi:hypothetical protein
MKYFLCFLALGFSSLAQADLAPEPGDENPQEQEETDSGESDKEESGCSTVSSGYLAGSLLPILCLGGALILRKEDS